MIIWLSMDDQLAPLIFWAGFFPQIGPTSANGFLTGWLGDEDLECRAAGRQGERGQGEKQRGGLGNGGEGDLADVVKVRQVPGGDLKQKGAKDAEGRKFGVLVRRWTRKSEDAEEVHFCAFVRRMAAKYSDQGASDRAA
jgi:hypothetical protein